MSSWKTAALALLLTVILAGCAAAPPPPVTALNSRQCAAHATDMAPRVLPFGAENAVTVEIDGNFPCRLDQNGKPFVEIVFQLPEDKDPYLLRVMSLPRGETMFSPRMMLTDSARRVTKDVGPDNFQIHGPSLSTIVRAQPTDRFLVIRSNDASVGNQQTHISEQTSMSVMPAGNGFFIMTSGAEGHEIYTLAYNGRLRASAEPLPTSVPAAITGSSGSRPDP